MNKFVNQKIKEENHWYIGSHFAWANEERIKRIYQQRQLFFLNCLSQYANLKKETRMLDCGCGDGYWLNWFSRFKGVQLTGIDYNPLRLNRAKALGLNAKLLQADLTSTRPSIGKFDIVFCSQVIEHVPSDKQFLKTLHGFLKPNGVLILGTPNENSFLQRLHRVIHWQQSTDHVNFYTEKFLIRKLNETGFEVINIYREVFYPGSDSVYYRLTSTDWGFRLLQLLTVIFPSQCSDYYFVAKPTSNL